MSKTQPFRISHPKRSTPIEKAKHREYFDVLKIDFDGRCGYCGSFDQIRNNDFEVDHFRPIRVLKTIKHNDYSNLVYSCKSCNRSKSGKWPSNDELIHVVNEAGFIDPADRYYSDHFIRDDHGEIFWATNTGKWMYDELALYNSQHSIIWMLEKLRRAIEEASELKMKNPGNVVVMEALLTLHEIKETYLNKLFNG